ncbi:MAG: M17 family metallopeptidase, partial [Candidatus Sumerlaeota bacterium]|nr:M17 family metallopeptidase [Candidatus Sumerlaeota bacterium]
LVGKGITFDSGGMCLKDGSKMWQMLGDMSGAAAVLASMKAIAQSAAPVRVTGVLCLTQNYIGPTAVKPGDIFTAKNGKTVHVLNTDAEGRLILTDGLARAGEEGATHVVDVATLTGAIARALGDSLSGLFANDAAWAERIKAIGDSEGEPMCHMPLFGEYRRHLDHFRTDINNTTPSGEGGALTAPLFLREFVPAGAIWAHLDIAGTAFHTRHWRYLAPGGRGVMIRTLHRLAMEMAANVRAS